MPPPDRVELLPHDPAWAGAAAAEGERLAAVLGVVLVAVHHIGSTAVPGLAAKPILDLIPVVTALEPLDALRPAVESLGYQWRGEYGLPGRRYCVRTEPGTGRRLVHLHCYAAGSPEIDRHLAFRDYLRHRPEVAAEYEREKRRCRESHPDDSGGYFACKCGWVRQTEAAAIGWWSGRG